MSPAFYHMDTSAPLLAYYASNIKKTKNKIKLKIKKTATALMPLATGRLS